MSIKLSYFDFSGSRGEECRLALHIAGQEFEDHRIPGSTWADHKMGTPWHNLPVLEVDGRVLGQSNAILTWIGRSYGLLPTDPWEAARHEALLDAGEEARHQIVPTLRMKDPEEKKAARLALADGYLKHWGANVEAQIGEGPFVGGSDLSVADLKVYMVVNWIVSGVIDDMPTDIFAPYPKLTALHAAVKQHPDVKSWYAA